MAAFAAAAPRLWVTREMLSYRDALVQGAPMLDLSRKISVRLVTSVSALAHARGREPVLVSANIANIRAGSA
jgi:hypothetical protein